MFKPTPQNNTPRPDDSYLDKLDLSADEKEALRSHDTPQSLLGAYYADQQVFQKWLGTDHADHICQQLEEMVSRQDIELLKTPLPPFELGALLPPEEV